MRLKTLLLRPFTPIDNTIRTKIVTIITIKINLISMDQRTAIIVLVIILVITSTITIIVRIPETYVSFARDRTIVLRSIY
jgi:hypothetical protein